MSSNESENRNLPLDAVIRELVANGEVSEDVLSDSDTIIRWWRSLDPTKQEEIKSRVEELAQGVSAEVPEKKAIIKTEKTWKPTVAAILMWISILPALVVPKLATGIGFPLYPSAFVLVLLLMFGGYYSLKRRRWNWVFAGAICSILSMPLLGIPVVILLRNAKGEFHIDEQTEKKPRKSLRPRPLFVVLAAIVLLLVTSLVIYAQISTPIPEPGLEPIPTIAGDLVIEVDENGLSINKNRFDMNSTLDDYIRILGSPSRVTELMNTIHTYDDTGIRLYQPPDTKNIISVSIDFTEGDYEFSPKHTYQGMLTIGHLSIDSGFPYDSLRAISELVMEDSVINVFRGTLKDIVINFDYRESKQRLDNLAISFSETSNTTTTPAEQTSLAEQESQEIEEGWVRLIIPDIGSIDFPIDFLELQTGSYAKMAEEYFQTINLGQADFTLQQNGLNDLLPSAFVGYRRVLFNTGYLPPSEEVFKANERYKATRAELVEIKNELLDQLQQEYLTLETAGSGKIKITDPGSIEVIDVNGMFPIVHTFRRQLNDNPEVLVKHYIFWNYDKIHHLYFSCRVVDDAESSVIYEKMLDSLRLE